MATSRITALKLFFSQDATRPVENSEMMAFWRSLNEEERQELSTAAAKHLGLELAEVATA